MSYLNDLWSAAVYLFKIVVCVAAVINMPIMVFDGKHLTEHVDWVDKGYLLFAGWLYVVWVYGVCFGEEEKKSGITYIKEP